MLHVHNTKQCYTTGIGASRHTAAQHQHEAFSWSTCLLPNCANLATAFAYALGGTSLLLVKRSNTANGACCIKSTSADRTCPSSGPDKKRVNVQRPFCRPYQDTFMCLAVTLSMRATLQAMQQCCEASCHAAVQCTCGYIYRSTLMCTIE